MAEILYSIIIPHYNIPELLERMLESVPYDKDDVEVIVVDDRSDKNVEKLLEVKRRYESLGVKFHRNNKGEKGAGTCRNIGIRHAMGRWLLFADADDRFTDDMYEIISSEADNEADIIFFEAESRNEKNEIIPGRDVGINKKVESFLSVPERKNELLLRFDMPGPVVKMIRTSMVKENGIWFDILPLSEDVMFSTKCGYFADSIDASKECLYIVTERKGSLMTAFDEERFRIRTDVYVRMCRYLKKNLSKEDWNLLGLNGNIRLIEAYQRGYGIKGGIYIFFKLLCSGIKPVEFKGMSIKTAGGTLKGIMKEKVALNEL